MKEFRQYVIVLFVMVISLSFYLPARYETPFPREIRPQFDNYIRRVHQEDINNQKPDAVLLGDSMLDPAVDATALSARLDMKLYTIGLSGSASTLWYLITKNNIVETDPHPKYLMIFFRDSMMTLPGYRVTGRYFERIDEFATPKDEALIQRAYLDQMNPLEKIGERYLPLYGLRWRVREGFDSRLRYILPASLLGCDKACMDVAMEIVFGGLNIDPTFLSDTIASADDYLYHRGALDFENQIDDSLLPELIALCQKNNIQLVLVRMRITRFFRPGSEPPALRQYGEDLRAYLEANSVIYLDYSHFSILTQEYYADPVHLNPAGKAIFTEQLGNDLDRLLK